MIKHVCAYNACANACRYTCMCTFIYVFQSARIFCMVKKRAEIIRIASALHEPSPESLQVEVVWNTALKAQWSAGMKWHGLPLYLYQAASRCQDHITEFFIIIHHISYIIIIFQKRHTKKTMQTQDQTQELHRRCVTSFSQEQGVQGKGNKLPISLLWAVAQQCPHLKIEVTFPRPGDTFVPPALQSQWIRVASRPGQVPQTNPTNIVFM